MREPMIWKKEKETGGETETKNERDPFFISKDCPGLCFFLEFRREENQRLLIFMEVSYHEEESAEKIHNRLRDIRTTDVGSFRYIEKLLLKLCKVINRSMKPETITNYKAYF